MGSRVAVLVSGAGTNLQALLDDPAIRPHVALVLSDRPASARWSRADRRGRRGVVIEPAGFADRDAFEAAVLGALQERAIDVVVRAGYMRMLGAPCSTTTTAGG